MAQINGAVSIPAGMGSDVIVAVVPRVPESDPPADALTPVPPGPRAFRNPDRPAFNEMVLEALTDIAGPSEPLNTTLSAAWRLR